MKVTAIIPDSLIAEVKHYSNGKNITESLIIALNDWLNLKHLADLNQQIENTPLQFISDTFQIRNINRL